MFHGMGDHASNSFSVDGQPITDQQSKVFSNQIPLDSVQSLEVIPGAPPAEFGGKTSLVIVATTRSGLGNPQPHGRGECLLWVVRLVERGLQSRGGSQRVGNFISANGMNTGRFLDPPEFHAMHDKGNEENFFDRVDDQLTTADSRAAECRLHAFVVPDAELVRHAVCDAVAEELGGRGHRSERQPVGPADQRAQIQTVNFSPSYTRVTQSTTVLTTNYFFRRDNFHYYPSKNPFADLGAPDLQQETIAQQRYAGEHRPASRT